MLAKELMLILYWFMSTYFALWTVEDARSFQKKDTIASE